MSKRAIKIKGISGLGSKEATIKGGRQKRTKKKILYIFIGAIIAGGLFAFFFWPTNKDSANLNDNPGNSNEIEKNPLDTESPLNGVLTTKDIASGRVMGVMVENHPESRPQSGLTEAEITYEMITEGGITRFLALYLINKPQEIGPVRSARVPFVNFANEYAACYAHVGGSAEAIALIDRTKGFCDLNQFYLGKYFWRDKSRFAPHNVYTTIDKLREAAASKKHPLSSDYSKWGFKDDASVNERGEVKTVIINFSSASFKVEYNYDQATNTYLRKQAGKIHTDRKTGKQILAKTVIIQEVSSFREGQYTLMKHTGSGKATIYLDGNKISGSWKKLTQNERTKFYNEKGEEVAFNRGPIWIEVATNGVTFN